MPQDAKSFRVTCDRAGRWHVAFAVVPEPGPSPGNGEVVGIDRGVAVSVALSTGEFLHAPSLSARERKRLRRLQRKLARARRGSNRRARVRLAIARIRARESDRRKDWAEKTSTDIARRFDVIRVEDLQISNMTRSAKGTAEVPGRNVRAKAGLNRGILGSGWGLLVRISRPVDLGELEINVTPRGWITAERAAEFAAIGVTGSSCSRRPPRRGHPNHRGWPGGHGRTVLTRGPKLTALAWKPA